MSDIAQRHFGLDWLRIGAFALLILYHVGMFFVPWGWHVKTAQPLDWVAIPMLATNSWRLALLFVVSGYASAIMLRRRPERLAFIRDRSARLMIPVIVAMIAIIPPQPWVELVTWHGYRESLGHFWVNDYFRFGEFNGLVLPTWQHLWFIVYLWVYSLGFALLASPERGRLQDVFDRLFSGIGLLLIPLGWALLVALWLGRGVEITHGLFDDPTGHLTFLPAFAFGVGIAGSASVLGAARRLWQPSLALALFACAVVVAIELRWPGNTPIPATYAAPFHAARAIMGWAAIVALLGLADRFWNRDHRWRATLTQAVFPAYIIHQTIIVWLGWWMLRFALPPGAEFALLTLATIAGCTGFYLIGSRIGWLRPLIGLKYRNQRSP